MDNEVKYPGRRRISKRMIWTTAAFSLGMFIAWYGGVDFTVRSFESAYALGCSIALAVWVLSIPIWTPDGDFK